MSYRCGTCNCQKEIHFPCGSVELFLAGNQLELMWLSSMELDVELMELCSV